LAAPLLREDLNSQLSCLQCELLCGAFPSRLPLKVGRLKVDRTGCESTRLAFGDSNDTLASAIEYFEHACIVRARLKPKIVLQRFA
jgi:hypothetical protein